MKESFKIIVPIDFLQYTDQIVDYTLYIGEKLNGSLKFVHIVEPPQIYGDFEHPSLGTFTEEKIIHAEKKMKQFIEKHQDKYSECEGKIMRGNIVDTIIKYAKDEKADLIIIGTHGRKGLIKMWLGSAAERVIKASPCPTLLFNPHKVND